MADVLNRCVKCDCCLSTEENPSKLLPCLHALCEECITGRTDALEKKKQLKEKANEAAEKPSSEENKPCDKPADVGQEAEAVDSETKVNEEDGAGKKADDAQEGGDKVEEETKEDASVEKDEETDPVPVPIEECPACKEAFTLESVIDNVFIRNKTTVAAGAESAEAGEQKEQMCTGCETTAAAAYCTQCDDWLCSDCVSAHKIVRMTKDHQLSSLEEAAAIKALKGEGGAPGEIEVFCKHHPKEKLSLFCEKCEVLTCRDCQLLNHQEHKYHFLQDAADTYRQKLQGSVSLMKEKRATLEKFLKDIENKLEGVKRDKKSVQEEVMAQANAVVRAVRASMLSILTSLHSFTDAACKRLSREVGDVGSLVGKFDHCISFMEAILDSGQGSALLASKAFVEAKCRKVYHTQMEPQSLKGQVKLQYRHDVQTFLKHINNFGAIYVNGSKYPPEKHSVVPVNNTMPHGTNGNVAGDKSGGQGYMKLVGVPTQGGMVSSMNLVLPHQTTSSRVLTTTASVKAYPVAHAGGQNSRLSVMVPVGMMGPVPLQQHQQRRILPHTTASTIPTSSSLASSSSASPLLFPVQALKLHQSKPTSAGPPPYPSARESTQVVTSGEHRFRIDLDSLSASGGHNTSDHSLPSNGVPMKSERRKDQECLLAEDRHRTKKSLHNVAATLGEMQRNLDDVIRRVPLDLGDHLQPIGSGRSTSEARRGSGASTTTTTTTSSSSVLNVSSPLPSRSSSRSPTPSSADLTNDARVIKMMDSTDVSLPSSRAVIDGSVVEGEKNGTSHGDSSQKAKSNHSRRGHTRSSTQVVPPPTPPQLRSTPAYGGDPNDDYCAACHQGGDVLCCDNCPRVFHLQCHVPVLPVVPSGAFNCWLCADIPPLDALECAPTAEVLGSKRKVPTGLSDRELKVCERLLLELFCHPSSLPFHEPVNRAVPNYYKIITCPMDFTNIKCKLTRSHFNHYATVQSFLDDCKLVFNNCATYNSESSEVGKAGKVVREFFEKLVKELMPHLSTYASQSQPHSQPHSQQDEGGESGESERKRRRIISPSVSPDHSSHSKTR